MATLATLLTDLNTRLNDAANTTWSAAIKTLFVSDAVASLYPAFYNLKVGTTTAASNGPVQTMPAGCVNLYYVAIKKDALSNRARTIRGWREGDVDAIIPKLNIINQTLIWGWTAPYAVPASTATLLDVPPEGLEVARLRAEISAWEQLLGMRVKNPKYFATQVREGVTEAEIIQTLDALHATVDTRLKLQPALPAKVG